MIVLPFSTTDTDIATGRAKVIAALNAQAASVGLGALFPKDAAQVPYVHLEVPGAAVAPLAPAQHRAAIAACTVVIDTADGLTALPDGAVTGYRFDLLVRLKGDDALTGALAGVLSQRWTSRTDSTRAATTDELKIDPARPALVWKQDGSGVRFHGTAPPRFPKHEFA